MQSTRHNFSLVNLLALVLAFVATTARCELKVGDALPDLTTFNLEGNLPDTLKGKVVLLDFWASWCLPCAASFPVMDGLLEKYGERGLVIIAVSMDEKTKDMEKFLKKHPVSFVVVRDAEHKLAEAVNPETMPTSFLVDTDGKVRFLHNGFHQKETPREYQTEIESLLKE
jgi:peroxiredoxin